MNKSKKLKILLTSFAAVATTGVVATTVASCGTSKNSNDNPTQTALTPATPIFASANLMDPVATAWSHVLPVGSAWSIAPNIVAKNIQTATVQGVKISSAKIYGILIVDGVNQKFTATASYIFNSGQYAITHLNFKWIIPSINVNPIPQPFSQATSVFATNEITTPVTNAITSKLPTNSVVSNLNINPVKNINANKKEQLTSANVNGTFSFKKDNQIVNGTFSLGIAYQWNTQTYTTMGTNWNIIINNDATSVFATNEITTPVTNAITSKLPTNSVVSNLNINPVKNINANKKEQLTSANVNGTFSFKKDNQIVNGTFSLGIAYQWNTQTYTTMGTNWNIIVNN